VPLGSFKNPVPPTVTLPFNVWSGAICELTILPVIAVLEISNALFDAPVITPLLSNVNEMVLAEPPTVTDVILFDTWNKEGETFVNATMCSLY
jgi:hypothetical protein